VSTKHFKNYVPSLIYQFREGVVKMNLYESFKNNLKEADNTSKAKKLAKSTPVKPKVIKGKTLDEYMKKFGDAYDSGELWDVDIEDVKSGALEPNNDIEYWEIDGRYYEAPVLKEAETTIGDLVAEEVAKMYVNEQKAFYKSINSPELASGVCPWDIDAGYRNADLSIVIDGDWKHDHLYCDNLVSKAATKLGYPVVKEWEESLSPADEGDDSYASIHFYDFSTGLNEADALSLERYSRKDMNTLIRAFDDVSKDKANTYSGDMSLGNGGFLDLNDKYFINLSIFPYPAGIFLETVEKYSPNIIDSFGGKTVDKAELRDELDINKGVAFIKDNTSKMIAKWGDKDLKETEFTNIDSIDVSIKANIDKAISDYNNVGGDITFNFESYDDDFNRLTVRAYALGPGDGDEGEEFERSVMLKLDGVSTDAIYEALDTWATEHSTPDVFYN
jgi:hypothetical protein